MRWLVLTGQDGTVAWASPAACDGLGVSVGEVLPGPLRRWTAIERCRQRREPTPLSADVDTNGTADGATLAHEGVRLRVRLVCDAYPALDALHLTPLGGLPGPEALRSLTLTPRQAEVLAPALGGRSSAEIAAALTLSPRTVEKHFESIYGRLGASNRSQAVAIALQALGQSVL